MTKRRPGYLALRSRGRPPEDIRAFEPGIAVRTLAARPHDCRCSWAPVGGLFLLKFRDAACPALYRHG